MNRNADFLFGRRRRGVGILTLAGAGTLACAGPAFAADPDAPTVAVADNDNAPAAGAGAASDGDPIVVSAAQRTAPGDPLEHLNGTSFAITQGADKAVIGPVAMTYKRVMPEPLRDGLRNALNNLREPAVFLNFMLQAKVGKAAETFGRFSINSTLGGAGLFDMARRKPFHLPRRPNGFADTFGFYGIGPGPYLFLPLVGPTTVRDFIGGSMDRLILPLAIGKPFNRFAYSAVTGTINGLNHRIAIDARLRGLREETPDPYAALRAEYLRQRQAEIDDLRGRPPGNPCAAEASRPASDSLDPCH